MVRYIWHKYWSWLKSGLDGYLCRYVFRMKMLVTQLSTLCDHGYYVHGDSRAECWSVYDVPLSGVEHRSFYICSRYFTIYYQGSQKMV